MEEVKPPVPVHVTDMLNFSRLALGLTDGSQILWYFKHRGKHILGLFTAYMYWEGDLPILAYTIVDSAPKAFLAYRSDSAKGEEWMFSDEAGDTRYRYGSFVELKSIPEAFVQALDGNFPEVSQPMLAEVEDIKSIARILLPLSLREGTLFPLWHFPRGNRYIVGTCIPFEHYYDADALPVFFYVSMDHPINPHDGFIKYIAIKPNGEKVEYTHHTSDAKFFYAKLVSVNDMPIFPK
ncbi:MAG TPA: hypothetical protein VMU35_06140 [Methylomirabilota bacterium]|nr:hypothetical protein [Methylomirabilota bacterium]